MAQTPLQAVNHLLDRLAHTMRVMGAVDLPPTPIASFKMPPPFETGLSAALRAIRIEQETAKMMYGGYASSAERDRFIAIARALGDRKASEITILEARKLLIELGLVGAPS